MRIAMISPEIAPFAKSGGLADVVQTLAIELERQGHELCLILPAHRSALREEFRFEEKPFTVTAPISDRDHRASVLKSQIGANISVYLVRADNYFDRESLYGDAQGDYPDNAERFVFFSRAALETLRNHPVDVIHCHDWHSALAVVFLKTQAERYPELSAAKTVFTIHNLGFQGIFPEPNWPLLNLDRSYFAPPYLEFYGNINFLKGAVVFADQITTVSPTYAQEIMAAEQGFGLDGLLRERQRDVMGILNGVDYSQWCPEIDPFIAQNYDANDFTNKRACKQSLQRTFALPEQPDVPLLSMICRLTSQKGVDLVEKIFGQLMNRQLQIIVLGSGEQPYEQFFTAAAACFPEKVGTRIGFDETLAHQIEAGADIFLMPSLYEPCGLNQMFSLKYGTIPIVRAVGGLKDTVDDCDMENWTGTGFVFGPYQPEALLQVIDRALKVSQNENAWTALRRRAMRMDFSWHRSAQAYGDLYRNLMHRGGNP